jgi:hypothetical protein
MQVSAPQWIGDQEAKNLYGELSAAFGSGFLASPPLLDFGIIQAEAVGDHRNTA